MESFILIIMLLSPPQSYGGGLNQAVAMQEFTSKDSCVIAGEAVTNHYDNQFGEVTAKYNRNGPSIDVVQFVCVRK